MATPSLRRGAVASAAVERALLVVVAVLALALRLYSAFAVPPWQGPDEPKHFEYARLVLDKGAILWQERRLLGPEDASPALQAEIIASLARHRYWERVGWLPSGPATPDPLPARFEQIWPHGTHTQLHRPSLYYYFGAAAIFPVVGADLERQLLALRLLSVLLGTATVLVAYATARSAFPGDRFTPVAVAVFVAGLPMHVFISGAANNDNLVALAGGVALLGLARGLRRGWGLREVTLAAGGLAIALFTKRTAVGLIPALALALAVAWWQARGRRLWLGAILALGGAGVAALGVAFAGVERLRGLVVAYALNGIHQWTGFLGIPWGSAEVNALLLRHSAALFASFWGIFGWFNVLLDPAWYLAFAVASGLALAGLGQWAVRLWRAGERPTSPATAFLVICGVAALAMIGLALAERLPYLSPRELPQGRYLFAALVPFAVLHAAGWQALLPPRFQASAVPVLLLALAFLCLNGAAYGLYIVPYFK